MIGTLQLLACTSALLLADISSASPFEWDAGERNSGSLRVIGAVALSVDRRDPQRWRDGEAAIGASVVPIALLDVGGHDHWVVRATAVFIPDSGATTFLDQLINPLATGTTLAPTPVEPGHLQPVPAFETRSRPLPEPPAVGRTTIRYHGEVSSMLPLSVGFLGLVLGGSRPQPTRPRA